MQSNICVYFMTGYVAQLNGYHFYNVEIVF